LTQVIDEPQMKEMLRDGVQLAKQAIRESGARDDDQFAVACMGCYGGALGDGSEYTGNYPNIHSEQDLMDFHRVKTLTMLQEDPDGIALETVPCVMECRAFVLLLKELLQQKSLPACWISLACRNGEELNDGSKLEDALDVIHELDPNVELIHAIGVNCCDSGHVPALVKRIATYLATKESASPRCRGIAMYPNSGEEWDAKAKTWKEGAGLRKDDLQDVFANRLMDAVELVEETWKTYKPHSPRPKLLLGGCCRTRPQTIAALRERVDERQKGKLESEAREVESRNCEQQRMLEQIIARDADLDRQIGEIGGELHELKKEIQQKTGEATGHQK
jgi:S-methylmethionine-dependent homocysteine/selenocysteine methylase